LRGLFFVGLFVWLFVRFRRGRGRSGSVKVESMLALRVVPELQLAEAKDCAGVVDGLEGDVLARECLAQKEPLAFPLDLAAAPNVSDLVDSME
jgi:hypothetical protein